MKKLNLLKSLFLLCALIVGSSSVWATGEVTIASFTASDYYAGTTNGWTVNDAEYASAGGGYYKLTYSDRSIVTPDITWSNYSEITITITARTFGGPSAAEKKISVKQGESELTSYSPGGTSLAPSSALSINPTTGALTIICSGASSNKGSGVSTIVIKGKENEDDRTPVASIGAISKEELFLGMDGTLNVEVTPATGLDETDYEVTWTPISTDQIILDTNGDYVISENAKDVGSVEVKATVTPVDDVNYKPISKTFEITISKRASVSPEGSAGGGCVLVTDATTLTAGDKLLIVSEGYGVAMSTTQNTNNRGEVAVTISEHSIASVPNTAQIITLEGTTDAWYFNVGDGYLYAASSSNNYLKTEEEKDNNAKATITINGSGIATIVFQGTNTRSHLRYNADNSLFSCYGSTSTMDKPCIYRQNVATTFDISITDAEWRTIVTALNVKPLPTGVKAYTAAVSGDKVVLTEVDAIKAGVAYVLNGAQGTHTMTVTEEDVAEPVGNGLKVSTETKGGNGVYVLANKSEGVGFYKWNGGLLGAGRVYVEAPAAARDFLGFDDETTGVVSVAKPQTTNTAEYYDLQGRRIAQPTKGLYIVNGKKVIIK